MLYEPSFAEASVSRRPAGVHAGNDAVPSAVSRLDVPRSRSISQRSSVFPRIDVTTRRPSGESRGCAYGRPDAPDGCSTPAPSTQTSAFEPTSTLVDTYTSDPTAE